jgi:hypothetical protein
MSDDRIPGVELTQWRAGRVLSEDDVQMLQRYLDEVDEDERRNVDLWIEAQVDAFMRVGGQELVDAMATEDMHEVERATQKAMKLFYEGLAKKRAGAN